MGRRKCSVKSCSSEEVRAEDIGVTFHKLPSNPNSRQNWMRLCQIEQDGKQLHVCSRHFLRADFANFKSKFMLKPKAVPSIFPWSKLAKDSTNNVSEMGNANSQESTLNNTAVPTKRVRKKKIIPDFITQNVKHNVSAAAAKSTDDESMQSEDSMSGDLPPVLEPQSSETTQTDGDSNDIPNLQPSELPKHPKESQPKMKTKKKMKKRIAGLPLIPKKKKKKLKPKLHEEVEPTPKTPPIHRGESIIKDRIIVQEKCTPPPASSTTSHEKPTIGDKTQDITESNIRSTTIEQKIQTVDTSTGKLTFEPNTRIEALDMNQAWSPATIVEVDYEENEVLVHFDAYSNKYEWIGINSSSIRAPSSGKEETSPEEEVAEGAGDALASFKVGERCMAYWDTKKFPATVKEVLDHDTYVVKFDDGYVLQLHVSKMTKSSALFGPVKSSKEERRTKKRKLDVQSLFSKSKKSKSLLTEASGSFDSADETSICSEGAGYFDKDNIWYPTFENGIPVGIPSQVRSKAGVRDSWIVPDPNLPDKWQKHVMQREKGKYFSIIITSDDKRLRSPSDIQRYIQEHPNFNHQDYRLDFNVIPRQSRALYINPVRASRLASQDRKEQNESKSDLLKITQVDGVYTCPIDGCNKHFRRENLVQMHVKHYHPEYKKFLDSTPNVLDLVYQRLHGDEFEQSSPGRSYDHYKRGSFTPVEELEPHEMDYQKDYQKDSEIKKLLNSTPIDSTEVKSRCQTPNSEAKLRDLMRSGDVGPDLKSLVVTTKSGLKTIPPFKKDAREEMEGRKRKSEEMLDDYSEVDGLDESQHVPQGAQAGAMDHIIGEDGKVIKIEHMRKEEIIHCTCGITEEDGLMIQCEICMCWQHAHCNNIYRETEVPEKYVCFTCLNPQGQRSSMKYKHDQDWLKHGRLPTGNYHYRDEEALRKRFDDLKTSHDISGGLLELKDYMHTLKQKIKIAGMKNHPKLYLWSKPWRKETLPEKKLKEEDVKEEGAAKEDDKMADESEEEKCEQSSAPQPEAAIETADCRINLLEHILHCQSLIGERLTDYAKQMDELEASEVVSEEEDNRMRLTTSMLVKDLGKLKELSHLI